MRMLFDKSKMKQITKNQDSNWNIFQDERGIFYSIATKQGCDSTIFCGNIKHIIKIIYKYNAFKPSDFTEYGINLIDEYLQARKYKRSDLFKNI